MPLQFNSGEWADRIRRALGIRGRAPLSIDETAVPVGLMADLSQAPYRYSGRRWNLLGRRVVSGLAEQVSILFANQGTAPVTVDRLTVTSIGDTVNGPLSWGLVTTPGQSGTWGFVRQDFAISTELAEYPEIIRSEPISVWSVEQLLNGAFEIIYDFSLPNIDSGTPVLYGFREWENLDLVLPPTGANAAGGSPTAGPCGLIVQFSGSAASSISVTASGRIWDDIIAPVS